MAQHTEPNTEPNEQIARSHLARQMAESFGVDPARYDRTRPRYPQEMIDRIVAASPGRDVLDVGAGTGVAARQFADAGCAVLGVEVDARMAAFACERGADIEVAKFEEWDAAGRAFDLVIAGQAWHWIDPAGGAAKARAVLRPAGRVAVFWNAPELPAALADAYAMMVDKAASGFVEVGGFSTFELWRFEWDHTYTRDEWLDQLRRRAPSHERRTTNWPASSPPSAPRSTRSAAPSPCAIRRLSAPRHGLRDRCRGSHREHMYGAPGRLRYLDPPVKCRLLFL
ncbi:class I SAM-dependent methyltransferase [Microbacterium terrisoli]|uniref:class I SAM-dependent methyltransferase n=1 Tax=Microbacterium terrisoli TaxID=3242192 RepID=UPI0028049C6A|nr:class I SAM-dependent methyltransferase [Microbacterium protaetiae]